MILLLVNTKLEYFKVAIIHVNKIALELHRVSPLELFMVKIWLLFHYRERFLSRNSKIVIGIRFDIEL